MNDPDAQTQAVAIVRCDGDTRYAHPGRALVKKGDQVVFQNIGAGTLILLFPEPIFEEFRDEYQQKGNDRRLRVGLELGDGEDTEPLTISAEPGCYPYAIFSVEGRDFVVGGSNTQIIVHRGS